MTIPLKIRALRRLTYRQCSQTLRKNRKIIPTETRDIVKKMVFLEI